MGIFNRSSKNGTLEIEELIAEPEAPVAPPVGDLQCTRYNCAHTTGVACQYVDRRSNSCSTAWCPDHVEMVDGQPYCQRHAGIMKALKASPQKGHLPDLTNRAPSLATWVGNDIDAHAREILTNAMVEGETLIVEPVGYVFGVQEKEHRWERAWKLADQTGISVKVAIAVDEFQDGVVIIRVGGNVIGRAVPPWVQQHVSGKHGSTNDRGAERAAFYSDLCLQIDDAVSNYRKAQGHIEAGRVYSGANAS